MKRQLQFTSENDSYVIKESGNTIFTINKSDLKFDALAFYNGLYGDVNKSVNIELNNLLGENLSMKDRYIFSWLNNIVESIANEVEDQSESDSDSDNNDENALSGDIITREIPLFELAACAGEGFLFDQDSIPSEPYSVTNPDADFAVKVSGKSMEPTIRDGSIVLVRKVDEIYNGDIGIFSVNNEVMCKRYFITEKGKKRLEPECQQFTIIEIDDSTNCTLVGKVLT